MPNRLDPGNHSAGVPLADIITMFTFLHQYLEDEDDASITYTDAVKANVVVSAADMATLINRLMNDTILGRFAHNVQQ